MLHWNQAPISKRFRDIRLQRYLGLDLDLSMSRDVIGHVTIRLPVQLFLLVLHCDEASISKSFRDIGPQSARSVQIVTAHERYHVTCTPMQNWVHILISHPHIAYSL